MAQKISTVVGARPQFVKCSLLSHELRRIGLAERLVHTGQHYNPELSDIFFKQLGIPEPDVNLGIGSDTQGRQTGRMIIALEEEFERCRPDVVLVFGDTNSTLAAALTAVKMGIRLAHVESGLRSRNRSMPEEHNRVVVDHMADLLFCHNGRAAQQLYDEQVQGRIVVCGDTMRETVSHFLPRALAQGENLLARLGVEKNGYAVLTVHRPVNADEPAALERILDGMNALGLPVVFPVHPRTLRKIAPTAQNHYPRIRLIEPVGYLDMLALANQACLVVTDSGGLQKEALFVGVPCVTLRGETEWTETVDLGMNVLAGDRPDAQHLARLALETCERHRWRDEEFKRRLAKAIDLEFGPIHVSRTIARTLAEY